jgi:hypothetical protein
VRLLIFLNAGSTTCRPAAALLPLPPTHAWRWPPPASAGPLQPEPLHERWHLRPSGASGFSCTCYGGYSGPTCNIVSDVCDPCRGLQSRCSCWLQRPCNVGQLEARRCSLPGLELAPTSLNACARCLHCTALHCRGATPTPARLAFATPGTQHTPTAPACAMASLAAAVATPKGRVREDTLCGWP